MRKTKNTTLTHDVSSHPAKSERTKVTCSCRDVDVKMMASVLSRTSLYSVFHQRRGILPAWIPLLRALVRTSFGFIRMSFWVVGIANASAPPNKWPGTKIYDYLRRKSARAYFANLFTEGGYRTGVEVGVAEGRYTEHFLNAAGNLPGFHWTMVDPQVKSELKERLKRSLEHLGDRSILDPQSSKFTLIAGTSLTPETIRKVQPSDFIYLDGLHTYQNLLQEMHVYWRKVIPGGLLAGHDFCSSRGGDVAPRCLVYTEHAGLRAGKRIRSNDGVVRAVLDFLKFHPSLVLRFTSENFTEYSLQVDGYDYKKVITTTRSPSWYIYRPLGYCGCLTLNASNISKNLFCSRHAGQTCSGQGRELSIILLYYGERDRLLHLLDWFERGLSRDMIPSLELVIVDDGSPINPAVEVLESRPSFSKSICVATVLKDKPWNIGGARNLGAYVASAKFLLMIDIDINLKAEHIKFGLEAARKESHEIYTDFSRSQNQKAVKPHPAVMLLSKASYWAAGGHDEDFVGRYGYTDVHFKYRASVASIVVVSMRKKAFLPPLQALDLPKRNLSCNPYLNKKLFRMKKRGIVPWSDDYLRFDWSIVQF